MMMVIAAMNPPYLHAVVHVWRWRWLSIGYKLNSGERYRQHGKNKIAVVVVIGGVVMVVVVVVVVVVVIVIVIIVVVVIVVVVVLPNVT